MAKLKLGAIADDKPVKLTVELSAALHRDLVAYGQALARETGQGAVEPAKLVGPMLARFMATDRAFAKLRRIDLHLREGGRERASSRRNATKRPTVASSNPGSQAKPIFRTTPSSARCEHSMYGPPD